MQHRSGAFVTPQPPNDETNRAHHYDAEKVWTVETYNRRIGENLQRMGATEKPCLHDGKLFVVDAKQLIEFIAESSGLIVEFPKRRKPQYSEESLAKLRERGKALQSALQAGAFLEGNGHSPALDSTIAG